MSIPFDADLTIMLSPDEHGVNVTFEGATIKGIFDNIEFEIVKKRNDYE